MADKGIGTSPALYTALDACLTATAVTTGWWLADTLTGASSDLVDVFAVCVLTYYLSIRYPWRSHEGERSHE